MKKEHIQGDRAEVLEQLFNAGEEEREGQVLGAFIDFCKSPFHVQFANLTLEEIAEIIKNNESESETTFAKLAKKTYKQLTENPQQCCTLMFINTPISEHQIFHFNQTLEDFINVIEKFLAETSEDIKEKIANLNAKTQEN